MPANASKPPAPTPSRLTSRDYGFDGAKSPPGKKYPWSKVERELAKARNYWIGTTRADGRPHSAPVWGVYLNGTFYFSTGDDSVKGRNIARDPRITVHAEIIDDAIILEGSAKKIKASRRLDPVWKAYKRKYTFDPKGSDFYALRPSVVFSYTEPDFIETATRWTFGRKRKRG
jgi:nitroimidazol reductase NimA-like FMN-containing flavoprotein (pyridoxamine 5'-phosphate oxidase superfamily)